MERNKPRLNYLSDMLFCTLCHRYSLSGLLFSPAARLALWVSRFGLPRRCCKAEQCLTPGLELAHHLWQENDAHNRIDRIKELIRGQHVLDTGSPVTLRPAADVCYKWVHSSGNHDGFGCRGLGVRIRCTGTVAMHQMYVETMIHHFFILSVLSSGTSAHGRFFPLENDPICS
ncbi:uncharacterized protein LOC120673782 [Panicum virgatum]|uniref:uncharacterized protein LOC120673782 n=1 Tax=Panicum virgatum TaxID=38727 RepID=UPI0019D6578D|nr:uncharacterized protein LOC120673782 [Panicum virgatum]